MAVKKDLKKTAIMQFGADGTKTAEGTKKGVTNATTDYPLVSPTPTDLLNYYKNTGTNVPKTAPATTPVVSTPVATTPVVTTPVATTPVVTTQAATTPVATTPAATTPAATQTTTPAASTTQTTTKTQAAEVKPFSYDDFNYDKQFTYGDFNYDKQFTYGDFNYDKQFSYGDFNYGSYTESDAVKKAQALLQQQNANKPGVYQSQWQDEISDYMNRISNRDPFSYNFNEDALYNQYKDNYIQQGQMAMMDTMGQAAAMTGGYGNSYAQTVGQQAYNQQLNQLNNVIPELYQMAFDRYSSEGQHLKDMLGMYQGLEDQDYGRYMDSYNAWQTERDYLANRYDTERANDYSQWESDRSYAYDQWQSGRDLAYDQYTADRNLAYDQWQSGRELAYDQYTADRNLAYDQWSSGRDLAYDQYTADRNLAYDQWSSGRDLAYDQYAADRNLAYDKWSSDRDLAYDEYRNALNMAYQQERDAISDAQWQAEFDESKRRYEEGKNSGGSTGSTGPDYLDVDTDTDAYWAKQFRNVTSQSDLDALARRMEAQGYNPDYIDILYNQYSGTYGNQQPIDTTVDGTTVVDPLEKLKKERQAANRVRNTGGGTF